MTGRDELPAAPQVLHADDGRALLPRAIAGPSGTLRVALVVPASGPLGLLGPSCLNCASLARTEVNAAGGVRGTRLELVRVDGGRAPGRVAREVAMLAASHEVDAVVGMHTSAVRVAVADAITGTVPYIFTPPYEGGEQRIGMLCTGETLDQQIDLALCWLVRRRHTRRWFLLGSDYRWPRAIHARASAVLGSLGVHACGQALLPLGTRDFGPALDAIRASRADAVLLNLIGEEMVRFHRAAAETGLAARVVRLSACLEENTLLGLGGDDTGGLWTVMGFFPTLATESGMAFDAAYAARFGPNAPVVSAHAESCYQGVRLLAAVANRAGSLHPPRFDAAASGTLVPDARGLLTVDDRHVRQPVYLAHADGTDFRVAAQLSR